MRLRQGMNSILSGEEEYFVSDSAPSRGEPYTEPFNHAAAKAALAHNQSGVVSENGK